MPPVASGRRGFSDEGLVRIAVENIVAFWSMPPTDEDMVRIRDTSKDPTLDEHGVDVRSKVILFRGCCPVRHQQAFEPPLRSTPDSRRHAHLCRQPGDDKVIDAGAAKAVLEVGVHEFVVTRAIDHLLALYRRQLGSYVPPRRPSYEEHTPSLRTRPNLCPCPLTAPLLVLREVSQRRPVSFSGMKDPEPRASRGSEYRLHLHHNFLCGFNVASHLCEVPISVDEVGLEVDEQQGDLVRSARAVVRPTTGDCQMLRCSRWPFWYDDKLSIVSLKIGHPHLCLGPFERTFVISPKVANTKTKISEIVARSHTSPRALRASRVGLSDQSRGSYPSDK